MSVAPGERVLVVDDEPDHGGHVAAESTLGRGTTIRLFFPGDRAPA